jgi:hypothetical protein
VQAGAQFREHAASCSSLGARPQDVVAFSLALRRRLLRSRLAEAIAADDAPAIVSLRVRLDRLLNKGAGR